MFIPGNLWSNPSYRVSFSFENKAVYCHSERSEESSGIYYEEKKLFNILPDPFFL